MVSAKKLGQNRARSTRIRRATRPCPFRSFLFENLEQRRLLAGDFAPDSSEPNDTPQTATVLGSIPAITVQDRTIHQLDDGVSSPDFYRVVASESGTLIVNALFPHADGNLDLEILDSRGNVIAASNSQTNDEQIVLPVVGQQTYFVHVFGVAGACNIYDLEIENFAVPVPSGVQLAPNSDTGRIGDDNITADATPRIVLQADLSELAAAGIDILSADQAEEGTSSGVAVYVSLINEATGEITVGYADVIDNALEPTFNNELFAFRSPELDAGTYSVSAASEIFDGRLGEGGSDPATGRSQLSVPLKLTIDTIPPAITSPQLLPSSDSGMSQQDGVTNKMEPAFLGIAEPGARVRILANGFPVGEAIAGSDARWEITTEPLIDGIYGFSTQAEDIAGNFSETSDPFRVEIDTLAPNTPLLDLVDTSDTGHSSHDNITSDAQPVFQMATQDPNRDSHISPFNYKFRLFVRMQSGAEQLVYDSVIDETIPDSERQGGFTSLDNLQRAIAGRLPDGVHNFKLEVEDRAGNISDDFLLNVQIDTVLDKPDPEANLTVDMLDSSDTGTDSLDNVTKKDQPAFGGIAEIGSLVTILANGAVVGTGLVGTDPTDLVPGNGLGSWEVTVEPLRDRTYEIIAHVEDWAGNFERSTPLTIEIDTTPPNTPFLDLIPDSDTGPRADDDITEDNTPTVTMTTTDPNQDDHLSQFNYLFRLFLRSEGAAETLIYESSTDANIPAENIEGGLTNLEFLQTTLAELPDGIHNLKLEVEDRAGNLSSDFLLTILIGPDGPIDPPNGGDPGIGPRIVNVTRKDLDFTSLFDPKPRTAPDPLIDSIVVHFSNVVEDDVATDPLDLETALEEGNYRLVGDANGNITISDVQVLASSVEPDEAQIAIELIFAGPLPDDRFTLTVFDRISNPAGGSLDGESGAAAPFTGNNALDPTPPVFPSGDGKPGGDFQARFTVDARPELGVWAAGRIWTDTNGNFVFDPTNPDVVNRDLVYTMGFTSDDVFAGNFSTGGDGEQADGFDKLGAYGRFGGWNDGLFRWLIDIDHDGMADLNRVDPANINGLPVAGQFDANAENGDEVGLYTGSTWYFDTDHDFQVDLELKSHLVGYPIVGDFDRDGFDDLGTWADDQFQIDLANGNLRGWDGEADVTFRFGFIGVRQRPVAADMDQDGYDDLGLWTPYSEGVTPDTSGEWYWLISGGESVLDRVGEPIDPVPGRQEIAFKPAPFGNDLFAQFGDEFALPVVGNFDPPVGPGQPAPVTAVEPVYSNPDNALDVNADGLVTPLDALLVINLLNQDGSLDVSGEGGAPYLDVSRDGVISPVDALAIINELNNDSRTASVVDGEVADRDANSPRLPNQENNEDDLPGTTNPISMGSLDGSAFDLVDDETLAAIAPDVADVINDEDELLAELELTP